MQNINSLKTSFILQMRVIWALIVREMLTRHGRENIGFLWFIGEPILFCAGVTIVWSAIRPSHEHGLPVPAYVVTGYVPLTLWRHCVGRALKAYESNGALLFHKPVTPLNILTSRVILEVIGTLCAGLIVVVGTILCGYMNQPEDYGMMYMGIMFHVLFCYAYALIIAALSEGSELVEKTVGIIGYLSIPLSGAFMMIDWLPPAAQYIVSWSPSAQDLEMIRGGQFGPSSHPHFDVVYNAECIGIMLIIGLSLTLRVRKHIAIQ